MSKGRKTAAHSLPRIEKPEPGKPAPAALYEIKFTEDAAAEIKALDGSVRKQLRNVLEKKLAADPEAYGLPLRGILTNYWKHQFASHRIIYRVYEDPKRVVVCAVGSRKAGDAEDVYRQLEAVAKTGRLAEQLASAVRKIIS
jgi:mRNA-degrading endonuclease RelE of RelBE toxin-antitoxin system